MVSWKSGSSGRSLMWAVLVVVGVGVITHRAREFASAVQNERTTTAHIFAVHHNIFRGLRFNYYSCNYTFTVDGSFHLGLSDCPTSIVDETIERTQSGSTDSAGTDASVYYDPANPALNSLLEFSAASENAYRVAAPWICLGALIIFFFVLGKLFDSNEKRGNGGVVVDARGTVIYPEEIGLGFEFAGLPNEGANSAEAPRLREQYLEVANKIHPDRATNEADLALRERLMKEANAAFERGDAEALRRVLDEYRGAIPAP
jgi:hypothetical protein